MNLTLACVWVNGYVGYSRDYVVRLAGMLDRALRGTQYEGSRFVCLTDRPAQFIDTPHIEAVKVPAATGILPWWRKIHLFDSRVSALQSGRCMYLDLDTVVLGDLIDIIEFPAPFALIPDVSQFPGKGQRKTIHRFNSSVVVWDGGSQNRLYDEWDLSSVTYRLWGDQDWIGERAPDAATMPLSWFPRLSECEGKRPGTDARVLLCKKPKNEVAADMYPWVKEAWQ